MSPITRSALLITSALVLAACSSTPVSAPPDTRALAAPAVAPAAEAAPAPQAAATTAPAAASTVSTVTLPPYLDPRHPLSSARSVFFDFDDATLKPDFSTVVQKHGTYLATNPAMAIRVEGNTDERGSAEYNLALGQKRAESVVRALRILGVRDSQLEAISWGQERPRATGSDESAWAQNRRADLQYPAN
ncbi:MAG: peptidoglycan-associated lipoprotein Pal [Rubrivivax sp.]|nr:peptidoglycan-associated lipoprotein Pal [Rubrivivax sp.]